MSTIKDFLTQIKNAVYGEDIRDAIHDSIELCYQDGKAGVNDYTAREQIANIVAHNNNTEGNSELLDIRTGYNGITYSSAGEAIRNQVNPLTKVVAIKNRHINTVSNVYPYTDSQGKIYTQSASGYWMAIVDVEEGKTYSSNLYTLSDKFSFFADEKRANAIGNFSDYREYTSEHGFRFTVPKGARFLLTAMSASDISNLVILELPIDIGPKGLNATRADYPAGEIKYLNIESLYSYKLNDTIENLIVDLRKKTMSLETLRDVPLEFEIGGLDIGNGNEYDSAIRCRSKMFYIPDDVTMMIKSTDNSQSFFINKCDSDGNFVSNITSGNYVESFEVNGGYYRLVVKNDNDSEFSDASTVKVLCKIKSQVYRVAQDGTGDFNDVQDALDFVPDSSTYPVTILIEPGTYDKISTLTRKQFVNDIPSTSLYHNRYISLVGVNEKTCIIKSDNGEYHVPAAEINVTGLIKNLTFISTHNAFPPQEYRNSSNKAYAVHSDYGTEDSTYENCTFISYQGPGVGIGGAQDKKIRFRNCNIYNYADANGEWSVLKNHGGLFYHIQPKDDITGQYLELKNCYIYNENGDKSVFITKGTVTGNYEAEVVLINNVFLGGKCGKTVHIERELLHKACYGNNVEEANYDLSPINGSEGVNSIQQTLNRQVFTVANELINESTEVNKDTDGNIISGAFGDYSSIFGGSAQAKGKRSQASGSNTVALGPYSNAEGNETFAKGINAHTEGLLTSAIGDNTHAEGNHTIASAENAHAEGKDTKAKGINSHTEGNETIASAENAHAEGGATEANGSNSHAEGGNTKANRPFSHSEGANNEANGEVSHVEGVGNNATGYAQHVQGRYCAPNPHYAHIIGNGETTAPSNAHTVDWVGNAWYAGHIYFGGTSQDDGTDIVELIYSLQNKIAELEAKIANMS